MPWYSSYSTFGPTSMYLGQYLTGCLGDFNMSDCSSVQKTLAAGVSLAPDVNTLRCGRLSGSQHGVGTAVCAEYSEI